MKQLAVMPSALAAFHLKGVHRNEL